MFFDISKSLSDQILEVVTWRSEYLLGLLRDLKEPKHVGTRLSKVAEIRSYLDR